MSAKRGVVVVTGGSAGVGRSVATAFGERGWSVAVLARGDAGLKAAVADVEAAGGRAIAVRADVADADALEDAAERVEAELGAIDVWVNNAMTTVFAHAWDVAPAELRRATEVTYLGQAYGTLVALRRMRPRDRGVICNVGSALAFRAIPLQAAYCGAKFAVRGFTEAVRAELLAEGSSVRVIEVHLPAVDTPQFGWCLSRLPDHPQPVPPVYAPERAAATIVEACLSPRRQTILGGFNHFLVLANKVAPGIVDHYVARTGVDSQQAPDLPADPGRPYDLWAPVDDDEDAGARGAFRHLEGGMTASWWTGVPKLALDVTRSAIARGADVVRTRTQRAQAR